MRNYASMKNLKCISAVFLVAAAGSIFLSVRAADTNTAGSASSNSAASAKPTPYPLDHCVVSGEKFGGDMVPPIVFVYSNSAVNQEIKFCCPMCKPQFLKDPDKYMKVIQDAEAKAKAKDTKN